MIHILSAELKEVLLQLLRRFVKPKEVNNITGANLQKFILGTVDILLPLEKCYAGPRTEEALKNLSVYDAKIEIEKMQKHYIEIAKYFQKKFLLNSQMLMLRDLSCLHPEMHMKTATVRSIERLAKRVPHVISVEDMPKIVDE